MNNIEIKFPGSSRYPRWLVPLAALCGIPFFGIFAYLGNPVRGIAASLSVSAIVVVAVTLWNFRKYLTLWMVLTISTAAHMGIVYEVSGKNSHFPAAILAPIFIVDLVFWQYLAVLAIRTVKF